MIKTVLKHWIYEVCIERLFDGIYKNFVLIKQVSKFKVGDRFEWLTERCDPKVDYSTTVSGEEIEACDREEAPLIDATPELSGTTGRWEYRFVEIVSKSDDGEIRVVPFSKKGLVITVDVTGAEERRQSRFEHPVMIHLITSFRFFND